MRTYTTGQDVARKAPRTFVSEYIGIANDTHADGKLMSEEPLRVYLITLQQLVDEFEPKLIAVRNRRPTLGQVI